MSCMNLDYYGNISASASSFIDVTYFSSFIIYIYVVGIRDSYYVFMSVSLLSDLYDIRNPSCESSSMSSSSEIFSTIYSTSSSPEFSSSDTSSLFPVMLSKMGIPVAH